jgi:Tol biopolymer transport system component
VTAVIAVEGGQPVKTFAIPRSFAQVIRWTADSHALTYLVTRAGVSNILRQDLEGNAPTALSDFKTGVIFRYDWSRDGKHLVMARGSMTSDVVLIKNSVGQ